MSNSVDREKDLPDALRNEFPELERLRDAARGAPLFLVGGAVRDLLLGRPRGDVDVVVEGDVAPIARALGGEVVEHERFATAKTTLEDLRVDLATARSETYARPGALPEVRPASLDDDLARRDFTINSMAIPLQGDPTLIDPHGGWADLNYGLLRALHYRSFVDDPTRAIRAARYAARFGFEVEPTTLDLLRAADLATVSDDRRRAELTKLASERQAVAGFGLLADWGLLKPDEERAAMLARLAELLSRPPWSEFAARDLTILNAALGEHGRALDLASAKPGRPSEAVELARGADPEELAIARALGGGWLDDYVSEWRSVALEIGGEDLLQAGVPEGPAIGRGLQAALRKKLDGEIAGRDQELAVALEASRAGG
jgi:tRNA nucleotidyltransferase (CCA-adding enzyme)